MTVNMIERIAKEIGDTPRSAIKSLTLDNCKASKIEGLDDLPNMTSLNMVNIGLTSLENFPPLDHLKKLDLSDNRLSDGLQNLNCSSLESLKLANNRFSTVEDLKPLANLTSLKNLDLFNCPVTKCDDYRQSVFELLPSLEVLDGLNVDEEEVESSESEADDDERSSSSGSEQVGLEYLKREDLDENDEEDSFVAHGSGEDSAEEVSSSSLCEESDLKEDSQNQSGSKRTHNEAFPGENGFHDDAKK